MMYNNCGGKCPHDTPTCIMVLVSGPELWRGLPRLRVGCEDPNVLNIIGVLSLNGRGKWDNATRFRANDLADL